MTIYAAIDTETWGLNRSYGPRGLAQLSIVIEDTEKTKDVPVWELPHFTIIASPEGDIQGEPVALSMNAWIINEIISKERGLSTKYPVIPVDAVARYAVMFINNHAPDKKAHPLGQNYGTFDSFFLHPMIKDAMHYRGIELASVFLSESGAPLSLSAVKKSLGFDGHISHNAYHEAMDYILCMRTRYNGNLTPYDKEKA